MTAELLAQAGGVAAATGLGVLLVARRRPERLAGLAAFGVGMALFVPLVAPRLGNATWAAASVAAVMVVVPLAVFFRRWPWAIAGLALVTVPARIPVTVGDTSAKLLLPLYAVIAGAAVALAWSLWREPPRGRELGPLTWPAALLAVWFAVSALWTDDVGAGAVTLFFFVLPFTLLALVIARLPWRAQPIERVYGLLVAMAVVFAGVGIWQWVAHDLFWNERVIVSNALRPFHRVNSVFWDPSMYGRFLVVAILASLVVVLFRRGRWDTPIAVAIAALWVGLLFSFSQSSFVALLVGLTVVAALAWRWRAAGAAVALCAVVAISVGVASPGNVRAGVLASSAERIDRATSGRVDLVVNGVRIAADHPLLGIGVGGFQHAYAARVDDERGPLTAASHTTPVTVAAETGLVGLALFAWLVAAAFVAAFHGSRQTSGVVAGTRVVAGVCLAAVFTHSLFYNAFFEDPTTWGLLALTALAARASVEDRGRADASKAGA